jgi:hypothetical protein
MREVPAKALRVLETKGFRGVVKAARHRAALGKKRFMEFGIRPHLLRPKIRHISGPQEISYGPDELLAICVVRNGGLYIHSFMEHHLSIGVKHFVFLDNGSTDDTTEKLSAWNNVTLLQTDVPYKKYENTMKRYLAEKFSPGRWNLCVDIDERFNYPSANRLSLRDFLRYLAANHYTAVAAQMLDMFSERPLTGLKTVGDDPLVEKYPYYDISAITKTEYVWSPPSNPAIKYYRGGIRKTVFGTNNGLTKSPLVLMDGRVKTFIGWHAVGGARMADISCVLMHYPFVSSFAEKVEEAARTDRYGMVSTDDYKAYAEKLRLQPDLRLKLESAQRFIELEQLIDQDFLIVSEKYQRWVSEHARQQVAAPSQMYPMK